MCYASLYKHIHVYIYVYMISLNLIFVQKEPHALSDDKWEVAWEIVWEVDWEIDLEVPPDRNVEWDFQLFLVPY